MAKENLCGLSFWHPIWLQRFANTKSFMIIFGLLGTVQAMSYMYFIVTLTTLEKRFKIPSQTTGIIMSGNEISQILLSLILSYAGGQRNRPRWIAWGMICCSLSCFILAFPHLIYGGGNEMLQLTQQYLDHNLSNTNNQFNSTQPTSFNNSHNNNSKNFNDLNEETNNNDDNNCDIIYMIPLFLIFLSQFILGIGNTLYYSLGQTYLDDNVKKKNTPLMLSFAMSLRMIGPILGFFLGYVSLNMFIEPDQIPLIDKNDQRWLGAWWFGWIILGTIMLLFSGLIGIFPKKLPQTKQRKQYHSEIPKVLQNHNNNNNNNNNNNSTIDEDYSLHTMFHSTTTLDQAPMIDFTKFSGFTKALIRLLKTKLLMFNIFSTIFYILGATGFMTFLTKYIEIQFHKNAQNATILVGPLTILGMVFGLILSGIIISKYKPNPSKLLSWNIYVGFIYIFGHIMYLFLYCNKTEYYVNNNSLNLTTSCNMNFNCNNISYNPVCHLLTETTYYSPCHAGCQSWDFNQKIYMNCLCTKNMNSSNNISINDNDVITTMTNIDVDIENKSISNMQIIPGVCTSNDCIYAFYGFAIISLIVQCFGSSGRIGNLLVNFRSVSVQDKSFAQGLALMLISLFALIPGPIIFGRLIDMTCLIWTKKCTNYGNCQLYDQMKFRYYFNLMSIGLTIFGIIFDIFVWYYGRHMDLYGEKEQSRIDAIKRKNRTISPLLEKK